MTQRVLAFDIGGTTTRAAVVDGASIIARRDIDTPCRHLGDALVSLAESLPPVSGVGLGVPEYVDRGVVTSTEVIAWEPDIPNRLSVFGQVVVDSDVRCAATAEWQDDGSLLYLSWGTGISTTLVLPDGSAWEGHSGRAIAFGERIMLDGSTLEATASGRGIENRYLAATGTTSAVRDMSPNDPIANALLEESGISVANALLDLARVLDPSRVVVGGGLGCAHTAANDALAATWAAASWNAPPLQQARHSVEAGLIGAALVVRRRLDRAAQ